MEQITKTTSCKNCKTKCSLFEALSDEELEVIDNNRVEIKYKKGDILFRQGTFSTHAVYLLEGLIKIYIENENKNRIIDLVKPKSYICFLSLFDDKYYNFSGAAIEDTSVCLINTSCIEQIAQQNVSFVLKLIKQINIFKNSIINNLLVQNQKNARGRLVDAILYFSNNIYISNKFELSLTRKELGEFADISTDTVIRILSELHNDGLINMKGKTIEIKKLDLLKIISVVG